MYDPNLIETLQSLRSNEQSLFDHIDQLESHFNLLEPKIQAFTPENNRFDRLRKEAKKLNEKYSVPQSRPRLFGLLIGIKDIFHADGFPTKAGSKLPPSVLSGQEAQVVSKMRNAGALILGKTVTTEFAYFSPGSTRNPHNLEHTPGGSSSGSAASVAANLTPFTTGTQTIGSISRPASFCGVVGYKPSYGRISTQGVIPLSPSVDHIGFFTKDLPSARFMAEFLIEDWKTNKFPQGLPVLGIPIGPYLKKASKEMLDHFDGICSQLALAGYIVKPIPIMGDFKKIQNHHNTIVAKEASAVHHDWFDEYSTLYHPKTAELLLHGQRISTNDLKEALAGREQLRHEISITMVENKIDLWLSPAAPGPAPKGLESTGNPVMNLPWTYSGLPTVCLPSGKNHADLPLGLQISGSWHQDELLLHWANKLEIDLSRRIG